MTVSNSQMRIWIVAAIALLIAAVFLRHPQVRACDASHSQVAPPAAYFPPEAVWTQDISRTPLDPRSSIMIDWLANAGGWGRGRMQTDFSLRVLQADAQTPLVPIHKGPGLYLWQSDKVSGVPLPAGGGMEGRPGYECTVQDGDCHLIVVDRVHNKLYEAWQANYTHGALDAVFLAVWDTARVYPPSLRGEQCTSADAAGLPIAPLLFNADELATGSINHAIRFILPNGRIRQGVYVHPATHAGAPRGPVDAPPYGARFRLKASYDVSRLSPPAQVVARALQKYGMILADGGNIALTAQSDMDTISKYSALGFGPHEMETLKVTDFEVVDGGPLIRLTGDCVRNH